MDSESCTRAFSQARVYLEQIRNRVTPGAADVHGTGKRDYLVDAAKQIRLALERDVSEDYEEAFNHYKNGVDVLLNGVQGMVGQVVKDPASLETCNVHGHWLGKLLFMANFLCSLGHKM